MIQFLHALPCGNAVSITLDPHGVPWVLLRRTDDEFVGYPDGEAVLVRAGDGTETSHTVIDYSGLVNGETVWYQMFFQSDDGWYTVEDPESVTPTYETQPGFQIPDPVTLVRSRLDLGVQSEVAAGNLTHPRGKIDILRSPPIIDNVVFPCITVLLESTTPEERGIGDIVQPDWFDPDADRWESYTGWLDRTRIQIGVWSLNAEERDDVRRAVQKILTTNLPIFDDAGLLLIEFPPSESFDPASFGVPVYQSVFAFSCLHPSLVRDRYLPIHSIEVNTNGERTNPNE
jgi:hypothetical protein